MAANAKVVRAKAVQEFEAILARTSTSTDTARMFEPGLWRRLCVIGIVLYQMRSWWLRREVR